MSYLAIWGAALSTLLAILEGLRFMLDRARLALGAGVGLSIHGAALYVDVVNNGRRPTTVMEVGFEPTVETTATLESGQEVPVRTHFELDGPPTVLAPGEMARYVWDFSERGFPPGVHVDFPLRAYARDLNRRLVWGPAAAFLRYVVSKNAPLPIPPEPRLVEPLPGAPFEPPPVYPRWKVWHGLGLRDPLPFERRLRRMPRGEFKMQTRPVPGSGGSSADEDPGA